MARPKGSVNYNLTGLRFGRLYVLGRKGENKWGAPLWECRCDCGNTRLNQSGTLRNHIVVSCGCFQSENMTARLTKHSHTKYGQTPTYRCWSNMIQRCTNPNNHHYNNYGGRGIGVCERWRVFANFLADMGEQPKGLQIDRKNNNKGYDKDNCKWSTRKEQMANRRKYKTRIDKGVPKKKRAEDEPF